MTCDVEGYVDGGGEKESVEVCDRRHEENEACTYPRREENEGGTSPHREENEVGTSPHREVTEVCAGSEAGSKDRRGHHVESVNGSVGGHDTAGHEHDIYSSRRGRGVNKTAQNEDTEGGNMDRRSEDRNADDVHNEDHHRHNEVTESVDDGLQDYETENEIEWLQWV